MMFLVKNIFIFLIILSISSGPAALAAGIKYYEIPGPRQFSINSLNNMRIDTIDKDTIIHVPDSAKVLLVEEFKPQTDYFESEVRAYTYQQAFYWLLAAAILVYVRQHT